MMTNAQQTSLYNNIQDAVQKCIHLADDLLQIGYQKQCLQLYNDLIEMFPLNSTLSAKKGLVHLKKQDLDLAISCFSLAIRKQTDKDTIAHYKLLKADAFYAFNRYKKALSMYTQILKKKPNKQSILYRKGLCFMSLNKYTSAIKYFDKALLKDFHYAEAHFMKGNCLFMMQQYRRAINHFINAIIYGQFSQNLDLLLTKGFCHYNLQQYDKAKICFDNGLDIDSSCKQIKFYLSLIKIKQQQKEQAPLQKIEY